MLTRLPLYPVLGLLNAYSQAFIPTCNSSIYCTGEMLHRIQLARIFPDSKTFVDMKLLFSPNDTLADFAELMHDTKRKPTREQLTMFVGKHFEPGNELEPWMPPDFNPSPPILDRIIDPKLKVFAKNVIGIWATLGRKVKAIVQQNPEDYSLIPVPNGFIAPGGRFKELYYWDSYWIIRGLLLSDMTETAKGMIENLLHLVDTFGYIPNGSRLYYLGRSQPPLLTAMVADYYSVSQDLPWLKKHILTVEKELQYWLDTKKVTVEIDGNQYVMLRYISDEEAKGPRPESYYEDYMTSQFLHTETLRQEFYMEMRSAAESGWDFSTRWFVSSSSDPVGNLTDVHATRILPVDLNSFFAGALQLAGNMREMLNDRREAQKWYSLAKYWRTSIEKVLWDSSDGTWYDYDITARAPKKHFYPSCVTPLWAGAVETADAPKYAARLVRYLHSSGGLDFPGGIPVSLLHSGEQWDYPNAWSPLQSILIGGLERSGHEEAAKLAKEQAKLWIRSNYLGYNRYNKMFEKYSAVQPGYPGDGGEYGVQDGFGWTNGVLLELLVKYGGELLDESGAATLPLPYVRLL